MLSKVNHIALIVSGEPTIDFYKKLGFVELSRKFRPEKNDHLIMLSNGNSTLEVFLNDHAPQRLCAPEAYGCRHIAFETADLDEILETLKDYPQQNIRINESGARFVFVTDPDGQPVEFMEVK